MTDMTDDEKEFLKARKDSRCRVEAFIEKLKVISNEIQIPLSRLVQSMVEYYYYYHYKKHLQDIDYSGYEDKLKAITPVQLDLDRSWEFFNLILKKTII
jgi:hypothetical protein